jgi:hypothetical protein
MYLLQTIVLPWSNGFFLFSGGGSVYNERLAIILGFITLSSGLAAFFSCRIFVSFTMHARNKASPLNKLYADFYKYHLYYWWAFGVMLVAHLLISVVHTGLPQAGDPDAGIHWAILGFGALSLIIAVVLFSSCRVVPRLIAMATPRNPFKNTFYSRIYRFHSYYWVLLLAAVLTHFLLSYFHTGIWPGA